MKVVRLFVRWARVGDDGAMVIDPSVFQLRDDCGAVMCPRFLDSECPLTRGCELSHGALRLDAEDLCSQGGYFELCDLRFCVAAVFGARFQWRYEVYIDELFQALSDARTLMRREVRRYCHLAFSMLIVCVLLDW